MSLELDDPDQKACWKACHSAAIAAGAAAVVVAVAVPVPVAYVSRTLKPGSSQAALALGAEWDILQATAKSLSTSELRRGHQTEL